MAQDAPKRRFLSLIFLVSCISKSLLLRIIRLEQNPKMLFFICDGINKNTDQVYLKHIQNLITHKINIHSPIKISIKLMRSLTKATPPGLT